MPPPTIAWSIGTYPSTMDFDHLRERAWFVQPMNLFGGWSEVVWTDDASVSGTSLFSNNFAPWVQVLVNDPAVPGAFTINNCHGQILKQEMANASATYMVLTELDASGYWVTYVFHGGRAADNNNTQAAANRRCLAYAMGLGLF